MSIPRIAENLKIILTELHGMLSRLRLNSNGDSVDFKRILESNGESLQNGGKRFIQNLQN